MGMTFEELGNILRTEREKQALSIEDVANRLKINVRVLRALEAADSSSLPHCVYVRGFVMSYARFLELDTTELMTVAELYDPSEDPSTRETHFIQPRNSIGKGSIIFVLLLCLCLAGGGLAWVYRDADLFSQIKTDHLTTAQPAPSATTANNSAKSNDKEEANTAIAPKEPENKKQEVAQEKPATQSATESKTQEQAASAVENKSQEQALQNEARQVEANKNEENKTEAASAEVEQDKITQNTPNAANTNTAQALDGPHRVIITAVAECWVHSIADDSDTRQFSLRSGDTFALTFTDTLTLKLGNAGGVRIRYNGQETLVPGRDGEVKTITFPLAQ